MQGIESDALSVTSSLFGPGRHPGATPPPALPSKGRHEVKYEARFLSIEGRSRYMRLEDAPTSDEVYTDTDAGTAREAWLAENSIGERLAHDWKDGGRQLAKLRRSQISPSELERADRAQDLRRRALDIQTGVSLDALVRFDSIIRDNALVARR
jgi:hypothetical protein